MDWVEGRSLADALQDPSSPLGDPSSPDQVRVALQLAWQLGAALDGAHALGVLHCDLKPRNVMICQEQTAPEAELECVLIDFGIARLQRQDGRQTASGQLGSIEHLAPEVALSQPPTRCTDVYLLGHLMYRVLTGRRHTVGQLKRPSRIAPKRFSRALDDVFFDALADDPEDRPPSCGALVERLVRALEPPSPGAAITDGLGSSWQRMMEAGRNLGGRRSPAASALSATAAGGSMSSPLSPDVPAQEPPTSSPEVDSEPEVELIPVEAGGITRETLGVPSPADLDWAAFWTSAERHFDERYPLFPGEPVLWALASKNGRLGSRRKWPLLWIWIGLWPSLALAAFMMSVMMSEGDFGLLDNLVLGTVLSLPMLVVLLLAPNDRQLGLFLTDRRLILVGLTGTTHSIPYPHVGDVVWRRRYVVIQSRSWTTRRAIMLRPVGGGQHELPALLALASRDPEHRLRKEHLRNLPDRP